MVPPRAADVRGRSFGMDDAAACGHPVDVARPDNLLAAEAVTVGQLALEQIGDGGEADLRMGRNVQPLPRSQCRRSHVIEKHEGAHRSVLLERQDPPTMPFRTIIITASMVSRARDGLLAPVSMTAEINATSILMTASVRIRVPYGSPNSSARQ